MSSLYQVFILFSGEDAKDTETAGNYFIGSRILHSKYVH